MNHWSARKLPCWQQWYLGSSVDSDQHISVLYFFVNKKSNYQWQRSLARFWHVARVALSCSDTVEIIPLWTRSGDVKSSCWSQEGFLSRVVASGKLWISWIGLIGWFDSSCELDGLSEDRETEKPNAMLTMSGFENWTNASVCWKPDCWYLLTIFGCRRMPNGWVKVALTLCLAPLPSLAYLARSLIWPKRSYDPS